MRLIERLRACGLVACLSLLTTVPAGAAEPGKVAWGVNGHPLVSYPGVPLQSQIDLIVDAGLKSYRVNIESLNSADTLGQLIALGKTQGVTIIPALTPKVDMDLMTEQELRKASHDFAKALVSRFKDDIPVWELGNEMENYAIIKPCEVRDNGEQYGCQFGAPGGVDALDYYGPRWAKVVAVLKGLSDGAREADPKARRAMGTAGWGHIAPFERMKKDGVEWDISVWHMYGQDPEWAFKILATYGRPIWVTEINHPNGSMKSEAEQAEGLRRWMRRIDELAPAYRVEAAHLYELLDEPYWAPSYEAYMGLVTLRPSGDGKWRTGKAKLAYFAVREMLTGRPPNLAAPTAATADIQLPRRACELERMRSGPVQTVRQRVTYVYCLALGRLPDGAGLESWTVKLRAEPTALRPMLMDMLRSDEFQTRYHEASASEETYVGMMYRLLLDRDADAAATTYIRALESGDLSRTAFIRGLLLSEEFKTRHAGLTEGASWGPALDNDVAAQLSRWRDCDLAEISRRPKQPQTKVEYAYCLVLGRRPDDFGLKSYAEKVAAGMKPMEIVKSLTDSDEFKNKVDALDLDPPGLVRFLGSLVYGAEPDQAMARDLTDKLNKGNATRLEVAQTFLAGPDFQKSNAALFAD